MDNDSATSDTTGASAETPTEGRPMSKLPTHLAQTLGNRILNSRSVTDVESQTLELERYVQPLPRPAVKDPDERRERSDYYEIEIEEVTQSLHPDLPDTTVWGFDGSFPGPIIEAKQDRRVEAHFDNSSLPDEHLFDVDERISGTSPSDYPDYDGPVPEVRTATHFHGLNIEPESDGQSTAWTAPDGTTGPGFEKEVQEVPNRQARMTGLYHDHAWGITRLNVYAGLAGLYLIRSPAEEALDLPENEYEIPLLLQDRTFNEDGSFSYPDTWVSEFAGDTALVNGAVWPYLEVEPRRYRFRVVNGANARTFNLGLSADSGGDVPLMYQISPDQGFLESAVSIGSGGDVESLLLAPFERAEVIVDFSDYAGQTLTVTNDAEFPYQGQNDGSDLDEVLQIRVTDPDEPPADPSADPMALDLPSPPKFDEEDAVEVREMTMDMTVEDDLVVHRLNGARMFDEESIVRPQLGTTEIWELENPTGVSHPIHLHLVGFEVIGRGPDGTDAPRPNERGEKDTVRVDPGETVRILVEFGDFTGRYPWHCHMLEHEDNAMMLMFEVVADTEDELDVSCSRTVETGVALHRAETEPGNDLLITGGEDEDGNPIC